MDPDRHVEESARLFLVVSVDFTEASEYALELGRKFVAPFGENGQLHVVHATSPLYWPMGIAPALAATDQEVLEITQKRLRETCFPEGLSTAYVTTPHLRVGEAAHEVAEVAREVKADLIIIGGHRRKGLSSALHRSMSSSLIRQAPCSVLTAIPKERQDEELVEPPCEECVSVRRETQGAVTWCPRHAAHRVHPHLHHGSSDPFAHGAWTFRT